MHTMKEATFCGSSPSARSKDSQPLFLSHLPPYKSRCSVCNNNDNNLTDKLPPPLLPPIRLFSPQETLVVALMVLNLVIYEILGRLDNVASDMFVLQGASWSWRHRVASCNESFVSSCILWIVDGVVAGSQRFLPERLMVWEVTDVFSRLQWSPCASSLNFSPV